MKDNKSLKDNKIVITVNDEMYDYVKLLAEEVEGNMAFAVRQIIKNHMDLNKRFISCGENQ